MKTSKGWDEHIDVTVSKGEDWHDQQNKKHYNFVSLEEGIKENQGENCRINVDETLVTHKLYLKR